MSEDRKLNGSVDLLAEAMRQVFSEGVEKAVEPLRSEMKELFAEQERKIGKMLRAVSQ